MVFIYFVFIYLLNKYELRGTDASWCKSLEYRVT